MAAPETPAAGQVPAEPDRSAIASQPEFDGPYEFPAEDSKPEKDSAAYQTQPKDKAGEAKPDKDAKPAAEDKKPEPAKPAAPEKPKHNEDLVELALEFGATEAEIEQVSPARLKAWVREQAAGRRAPPEPKTAEPKADDAIEFEFDGKKHSIKADDLDPSVVALFRHFQVQNKTLTEQVQAQVKFHQQARAAAVWDAVDEAFAGLDKAVFGDGGRDTLDPKSAEYERRKLVVQAAGIELTDTPAQVRKKLAAKAALFGPPPAPKADAKPESKAEPDHADRGDGRNEKGQFVPDADARQEMKRWDDAALPPPTASREPGPGRKLSPEEASDKAVAETMKRIGLVPNGRR